MPIKSGIRSTHSSSILSSDIIKEIGLVPPHGWFMNKWSSLNCNHKRLYNTYRQARTLQDNQISSHINLVNCSVKSAHMRRCRLIHTINWTNRLSTYALVPNRKLTAWASKLQPTFLLSFSISLLLLAITTSKTLYLLRAIHILYNTYRIIILYEPNTQPPQHSELKPNNPANLTLLSPTTTTTTTRLTRLDHLLQLLLLPLNYTTPN